MQILPFPKSRERARVGKVEAKGGKETASASFLGITHCARSSVHDGEAVVTDIKVAFHFVLFRLVYVASAFWTTKPAHYRLLRFLSLVTAYSMVENAKHDIRHI